MFFISPEKLLIVSVVAIVVLGPEKLPRAARELGAAWRLLQGWRSRLEAEARQIFPDLPPLEQVAQVVRSPLKHLDLLVGDGQVGPTGNTSVDEDSAPSEGSVPAGSEPSAEALSERT